MSRCLWNCRLGLHIETCVHTTHCPLDAHVISAVGPVGSDYPGFIEETGDQARGDGGTCRDARKGPRPLRRAPTEHREGASQAAGLLVKFISCI